MHINVALQLGLVNLKFNMWKLANSTNLFVVIFGAGANLRQFYNGCSRLKCWHRFDWKRFFSNEFCREIVKTVQYAAGKIFQWKVSTTPTTTKGSLCQLGQPTSKPWKSEILKEVIFFTFARVKLFASRDKIGVKYFTNWQEWHMCNMSESCKWVGYVFK